MAHADALDEAMPDPNEMAELASGTGLAMSRARTAEVVWREPRLLSDAGVERRIVQATRRRWVVRGTAAAALLLAATLLPQVFESAPAGPHDAHGPMVAALSDLPPELQPLGEDELAVFRAAPADGPRLVSPRGMVVDHHLRFAAEGAEGLRVRVLDSGSRELMWQGRVTDLEAANDALAGRLSQLFEVQLLSEDGRVLDRNDFELVADAQLETRLEAALLRLPAGVVRDAARGRALLRAGFYEEASHLLNR